jgi:hypothetical protein
MELFSKRYAILRKRGLYMVNRKKIVRLRVKREGRLELGARRGLHFCNILVEKARDKAIPSDEIATCISGYFNLRDQPILRR